MEETQEEKSFKKKKKFVYLDKYETYKEGTAEIIRKMQKRVEIGYVILAMLIIAVSIALAK